jgi:hypothetical protein
MLEAVMQKGYRHTRRIPAKSGSIALYPLKKQQLIQETKICGIFFGAGMKKAQCPEPVIE